MKRYLHGHKGHNKSAKRNKTLCNEYGCPTRVKFKEGGIRGKCSKHGGYPLCDKDGCPTPVNFKEGGIRGKCKRHGGYPRCDEDGCSTPVNFKEGGMRGKCRMHGGFPTCVSCHLFTVRKLGRKCSYCSPCSATAKYAKKEELAVAKALDEAQIPYQREVRINYNCFSSGSKRWAMLDFVIELPDKRVIGEVDENQHNSVGYNIQCDLARMTHVMAAIACEDNTRPTLWIRFNPNAFSVDGERVRITKKKKLSTLVEMIKNHSMTKHTEIMYMYYDADARGVPLITKDTAYSKSIQSLVVDTVIS
jgi:hypothetical protein